MTCLENQQLRKVAFYLRGLTEYYFVTPTFYRKRLKHRMKLIDNYPPDEIHRRVNYYNRLNQEFEVPDEAFRMDQIPKEKTAYFLDLHRVLRYFPADIQAFSRFGDKRDVNAVPGFVKTRPLGLPNKNSVLLRLNSIRHFRPINDKIPYCKKKGSIVWRGTVKPNHRRNAVFERHFGNPRLDIGMTNERPEPELQPWRKPFLPIAKQLEYKFILSVEGNDVATNLKWIAQSNSLCFMTRPRHESWFMEGTLEPGTHYVEVRDDYADLIDKMDYYLDNPDESEAIIANFQAHYQKFTDPRREDLINLLVAEKYLQLSGQLKS